MYSKLIVSSIISAIFIGIGNGEVIGDQASNCFHAPNVCPNKNITFWLYTWDNQQNGIQLDIDNRKKLNNQLPSKEKPIKILIHGYLGGKNDTFNNVTREAIFKLDDPYVISVDWSPLTQVNCTLTSARNTRVVGNCIANLIDKLIGNARILLEKIHVIGFSYGAQTAGFISPNLKCGKKLAWISGLDPSLQYFDTPDKSQQLDQTDADYVDVYHAAIGYRSQIKRVGHCAFYFNDGQNQPGCRKLDLDQTYRHLCSHERSFKYYAGSVTHKLWVERCGGLPLHKCNPVTDIRAGYYVPYGTSGVFRVITTNYTNEKLNVNDDDVVKQLAQLKEQPK
ncbi:phospholipase A1-like [Chrysoperla carnea]|uniref:phospholipase A1-like n=1 Tax=Chrysoperla carnea TaxID=189513 RepID=UPI001D0945B4|nr:phospholipase A1-like [Chrysoperla carnea]